MRGYLSSGLQTQIYILDKDLRGIKDFAGNPLFWLKTNLEELISGDFRILGRGEGERKIH